ncbi:MAG: NADH-quinone oxidoreductase subunit A [Deltaproteobacteria bacterium]|nr:NADH-quinone oxidoreductase subunit A [Deltaproteobacteria bacterium]MCL5791571.1 NADH-quinone oxidoreductase subunit A [Deltaproteobacteria bacterium]
MMFNFANVFTFIVVGSLFVAVSLFLARLIRPAEPNLTKMNTYECGEDTIGNSWITFNIRFYVVALIFIIFDVEAVFLFPWAIVYKSIGWMAFWDVLIFIVILLVGLAYVWGMGDLNWIKELGNLDED